MEYIRTGNTCILRLQKGEEILTKLKEFSEKEHVTLAKIEAIGATNDFTVGAYDSKKKQYRSHHYTGEYEILSLLGNITTKDGEFYCHLHMSCGSEDGSAVGGHLNSAVISVTCEMFVTVLEGKVERKYDEETGINLFYFE